jgi:hypothetical protein
MPKQVSHIPRSLEWFRDRGYKVDICERRDGMKSIPDMSPTAQQLEARTGKKQWKQIPGNRRDFFEIADLGVLVPGKYLLLVQVCSRSQGAAHRKKILEADAIRDIQAVPGLEVCTMEWEKKANRWRPTFYGLEGHAGWIPVGDDIFNPTILSEMEF